MKKVILVLFCSLVISSAFAQHNYDGEGVIYSENGNVGVGVDDPNSKMEIKVINYGGGQEGSIDLVARLTNTSIDVSRWISKLGLKSTSGGSPRFAITNLNKDNAGNITTNIEVISIPITSGNVGIGTTVPDEKLTVNGTIHALEILVDSNITPDYVFQKYYTGESELKQEYRFKSLEEIEKYAKENHRLPDVPSSEQIKKEGLKLKEMTNLLLQKIEELTLHAIEQEKRIKSLENKLKN